MRDLVYSVAGSEAAALQPVTLSEAGFKERAHLQEWVRKNAAMLGDDVLIVTFEFDRWIDGSGTPTADRLDLLGIDRDGRLVVVELKREKAPETTDMQAVKYAAMASRFTLQTLAQQHALYLTKVEGTPVSADRAMELLRAHIGDADRAADSPSFERPRIVLMATDFPSSITATAVFLTGFGLEVTLLRFRTFKTPKDEYIIVVTRLFPIQEIEEYRISPRLLEEVDTGGRERSRRTVHRLIEYDAIAAGTRLEFRPDQTRAAKLEAFLAGDPLLSGATWDPSNTSKPLIWDFDKIHYSPSGLSKKIFEAGGLPRAEIWGPNWWTNGEGQTLVQIANALTEDE